MHMVGLPSLLKWGKLPLVKGPGITLPQAMHGHSMIQHPWGSDKCVLGGGFFCFLTSTNGTSGTSGEHRSKGHPGGEKSLGSQGEQSPPPLPVCLKALLKREGQSSRDTGLTNLWVGKSFPTFFFTKKKKKKLSLAKVSSRQ